MRAKAVRRNDYLNRVMIQPQVHLWRMQLHLIKQNLQLRRGLSGLFKPPGCHIVIPSGNTGDIHCLPRSPRWIYGFILRGEIVAKPCSNKSGGHCCGAAFHRACPTACNTSQFSKIFTILLILFQAIF